MIVERVDSGLLNSSMYVVSENGHAIVIDPCLITDAADKFIIDYLFITHEHYDHIFGVNAWKEQKSNFCYWCSPFSKLMSNFHIV